MHNKDTAFKRMGGYGVALCELRFQVAGGYGGVAACCLACGLLAACALGSLILRFAMFAQNNCNKPDQTKTTTDQLMKKYT